MNKKGHAKTLVASHPGNTNALRYGVYSPRTINQRAAQVEEELLGSFEPDATERIAAHEVARCRVILEAIDLDLDECGLVDRKGEARSLLAYRARISRDLGRWLEKISTAINRQAAREHMERSFGSDDYVRELRRIALGDDPNLTPRDRLRAMKELYELERGLAYAEYRAGSSTDLLTRLRR